MRAGSNLLMLAVVWSFGDCTTSQAVVKDTICIKPSDSGGALVTFDELSERLENDESDMFKEGVEQLMGDDSPTLEDLNGIATNVKNGLVPDFMTDYGYKLLVNASGTYADATNNGKYDIFGYGLMENLGTEGSYSMTSIVSTHGEIAGYAYTICSSLFGRVNYTKTDSSLNWQGSASGVYLMLMPDGSFAPYGTHIAAAEGLALAHQGKAISSTDLLFILNSTHYSSRTTGQYTGKVDSESHSGTFNMFSLTGGTNATIGISSSFSPEESIIHSEVNMILRNAVRESAMKQELKGFCSYDKYDPLSDKNLFSYFQNLFLGVNTYLP